MDFYTSYRFLKHHKMFQGSHFGQCLDIDVVKVNPETNRIEDDHRLNTKTSVWLECGSYVENSDDPMMRDIHICHDPRLDCGADTFEQAIIKLAQLVQKYYD